MQKRGHRRRFEIIKIINNLLDQNKQTLKIIELHPSYLLLSSGKKLENNAKLTFLRRCESTNTFWIQNIDNIYLYEIADRLIYEYKQKTRRIGGLTSQRLYNAKKYLKHGQNKGKLSPRKGIPLWNDKQKLQMSLDKLGNKNPMFGTTQSLENRINSSVRMKEKILNGKFTPNTKNSRTHWTAEFNGIKFRSSWEALCYALFPMAQFEKLRIKYNYNNVEKIYIVDFIIENPKLVIEVKPKEHCNSAIFLAKKQALHDWCCNNNYKLLIADQEWFKIQNYSNLDFKKFNNETLSKIKFLLKGVYEIN